MLQEDVHTDRVAVRKYKEISIARYRVYSSISVAVLTDMVAWNPRSYTFSAPAMLGLVDPSKAGFVLKTSAEPVSLLHC